MEPLPESEPQPRPELLATQTSHSQNLTFAPSRSPRGFGQRRVKTEAIGTSPRARVAYLLLHVARTATPHIQPSLEPRPSSPSSCRSVGSGRTPSRSSRGRSPPCRRL